MTTGTELACASIPHGHDIESIRYDLSHVRDQRSVVVDLRAAVPQKADAEMHITRVTGGRRTTAVRARVPFR